MAEYKFEGAPDSSWYHTVHIRSELYDAAYLGSGSIINGRYVLTAKHVAIKVEMSLALELKTRAYPAFSGDYKNPKYAPLEFEQDKVCYLEADYPDIAIIKLKSAVSSGFSSRVLHEKSDKDFGSDLKHNQKGGWRVRVAGYTPISEAAVLTLLEIPLEEIGDTFISMKVSEKAWNMGGLSGSGISIPGNPQGPLIGVLSEQLKEKFRKEKKKNVVVGEVLNDEMKALIAKWIKKLK